MSWILHSTLHSILHSNKSCFVFPTLGQDLVVTSEENRNVVFPFYLDPTCGVPNNTLIQVSKVFDGKRGTVCSIKNGVCQPQLPKCTCLQNGTYQFRTTVQMTDRTTWIWWAGTQTTNATELFFNVTQASTTNRSSPSQPNQDRENKFSIGMIGVILGGFALLCVVVFVVYMLCVTKEHKKGTSVRDDHRQSRSHEAGFLFPTLGDDLVVTSEENESVVLPFHLHSTCRVYKNADIHISKLHDSGARATVCTIRHDEGGCLSQQSYCICLPNGIYEFRRTVQLKDSAMWIWWISSNSTVKTELFFNITRVTQVNTESTWTEDITNTQSTWTEDITNTQSTWTEDITNTQSTWTEDITNTQSTWTEDITNTQLTWTEVSTNTQSTKAPFDVHDDRPTNYFWSGSEVTVLGSVGIAGVTAIVITITVVRAKKGREKRDSIPQSEQQAEDRDADRQERPATSSGSLYWEIQDVSTPPSPDAPSAPEAVSDDGYLTPVSSAQAPTGAGVTDNSSLSSSSETLSRPYERPVNPDYTIPNPVYEPLRHLYQTVSTE